MKDLSPQERKFADALLRGTPKREAALHAGYAASGASVRAQEILARPHVKEYLAAFHRREEDEVAIDREIIRRELMAMIVANPASALDDEWNPLPRSEVPEVVQRMILSARTWDTPEQGRGGSVKFINRLDLLKTHLKYFPVGASQAESLESAALQVQSDIDALIAKFEAGGG